MNKTDTFLEGQKVKIIGNETGFIYSSDIGKVAKIVKVDDREPKYFLEDIGWVSSKDIELAESLKPKIKDYKVGMGVKILNIEGREGLPKAFTENMIGKTGIIIEVEPTPPNILVQLKNDDEIWLNPKNLKIIIKDKVNWAKPKIPRGLLTVRRKEQYVL